MTRHGSPVQLRQICALHESGLPMPKYAALLNPLESSGLEHRNRLIGTAHVPRLAEDGMPGEAYRLHHAQKARGGIVLTIFGGSTSIAPESPLAFNRTDASSDRVIPYFPRPVTTRSAVSTGLSTTSVRARGPRCTMDCRHSRDLGELDHETHLAGARQRVETNPNGEFMLYRIGDALVARNVHAAIYVAARIVKAL